MCRPPWQHPLGTLDVHPHPGRLHFLLPVLLAIAIAGVSLGCAKQNALMAASENLSGKWTWVSTDGGIANNIHNTPASTGNTMQLEFKAGNTYTFYLNGAVESKGTYQITREKSSIVRMTL